MGGDSSMSLEAVHPRNLTMAAWRRQLHGARTTYDVLHVVNEFLRTWYPDEIERLAEACRPGPMRETSDVRCYAMQLARREFAADCGAIELLRMAGFFETASRHLAQIARESAPASQRGGIHVAGD